MINKTSNIQPLQPSDGAAMSQYRYFQQALRPTELSDRESCLTINQSGSPLGLINLLDLISHEIHQEDNQQFHRLTFKSGQTLCINANAQLITVRGSRVNFHADSHYPYATYLGDPARTNNGNKLSI